MKDFWDSWKKQTEIEQRAIETVKKARQIILHTVPLEELTAIYVKGSFPRREMNENSDIDTVTILKTNRYRKKIEALDLEYKKDFPRIEFSSFSLWELKNNKHFYTDSKLRARPDRFVARIQHYPLIYGHALDTKDFKVRTPEQAYKNLREAFDNAFLPQYKAGKFSFQEMLKQVFWLAELEGQTKGRTTQASWKELCKSIKDKNHLVHEAYQYRLTPPRELDVKQEYIAKLTQYLKETK